MIRWQFGFTPINLMQWTLGRSCSRFLFLSRVWLFKRETRLAARFPLLVAKPSGPCARPTRRETTSIGKSNENRQTLCKFHNTMLQIVSYAKDGIILLKAMVMLSFHYGFSQSLFCNRIVVSSEIEASPILIVFLSPHQNLWFSRVCKYWQDKIRDTNRSKTNALCRPN